MSPPVAAPAAAPVSAIARGPAAMIGPMPGMASAAIPSDKAGHAADGGLLAGIARTAGFRIGPIFGASAGRGRLQCRSRLATMLI